MKKYTTKNNILNSEKELNEYLLNSFSSNLKQAIKSTVQIMVRSEMEIIRENLNNHPVFNGTYNRHLVSPAGKIDNIPIARFRSGNKGHSFSTLKVFDEEKERFYNLVAEMHAVGISQRKINKLCKHAFGKTVSPQTTKKVFGELLEQETFQINKQLLADVTFDYIYADGLWQTVIGSLTGKGKDQAVLAVSGYNIEYNEHKFLGFLLADSEDAASWEKLFADLTKRGLNFEKIKLLIADGGGGLLAAIEKLSPNTKIQLCLSHKYRNVLKHTSYRHKKEMGKDLKRLTMSKNKNEFLSQAKKMEKKWQMIAPRAIKSLKWKFKLSISYFDFPEKDWKHIRTTNKLERAFREIRRRTAIQNHYFQSNESAMNYLNASMLYGYHR